MAEKYISVFAAIQAKPEYLNENHENKDRALYAKGWNACNEEFIDNLHDIPAEDVRPMKWIPVTERLPEDGVPVQACYIGFISGEAASDLLACRYEGMWCYWDGDPCSYNSCNVEITHWMPLPEPPKGGADG